ncbi:unnamed protein product, partial [Mesorhabditis belari]|uniref:Uncharacterized protein n=1 Tax=Mesorhabditis belari TaxID=2138241 RepID=A0AAF3F382_9BILA
MGNVVVSYFVYEAPHLQLPDLVICPFNRFNRTFLESHNISDGLIQYMELSFPIPILHSFQIKAFYDEREKLTLHDNELEELLLRMGNISYRDFLNKASLPCEAFMNNPSDCVNSTEVYSSTGKCYRIPGETQITLKFSFYSGFGQGYRRIINLPTEHYSPAVNQVPNDGLIIRLVEKGLDIDNDLTFVPIGVHALFPITAVKYEFMNDPPKYTCHEEGNKTYSSVYCLEECFMAAAEQQCNCSVVAATMPQRERTCTTKEFYTCFLMGAQDLWSSERKKKCRLQCPLPCTYWEYEKQISFASFPSKSARQFVKDEKEWEKLQSTIILEIYFKDLKYTSIKHVVAMPFQSLIAQIGGQFGLWAGGSVICLLQTIIYTSRHLYYRCSK